MGIFRRFTTHALACVVILLVLSGCTFLPGFGLFEAPALYFIDVNTVANQVSCELQAFVVGQQKNVAAQRLGAFSPNRWLLGDEDAKISLTLNTDESGYINFTGIDLGQLGLQSLASFVALQSKVPSLGAKVSTKRTKTVQIDFSVSTKTSTITRMDGRDEKGKPVPLNCSANLLNETPASKYYFRDWLTNYFDTINYTKGHTYPATDNLQDKFLRGARGDLVDPAQIPDQFKIQSVKMTTTILVAADISAGTTPSVLGNGSVFILPVSGQVFDYNPSYSHKLDVTLTMCDARAERSKCAETAEVARFKPLFIEQCRLYAKLQPLLNGVSPPVNFRYGGQEYKCNKEGEYGEVNSGDHFAETLALPKARAVLPRG